MTNTQSIQNLIEVTLTAKTTNELLDMLDIIEGDTEARAMRAEITDTIAARHGLNDALDTIAFADIEFIGTQREEIALAMTLVAA